MRGLGAELCKNIVLAGVRSVTVLDSEPLGPEDAGGRFLGRTEGENVSHTNHWLLHLISKPFTPSLLSFHL